MTGNEIREKFLQYFERHGHTRVRSSPLLPANDPTLLFTNAGMNQFKDVFLGVEKREYVRACSSQKCLRAGGKHNDLDEVGKTARHQTFFEMLGNFSFGDYFKEDAIKLAWDLLVNEFKLDPARMWFSVFAGDDEVGPDEDAEKFWEQVGAPRERILRFGRKDNFWQMGEAGPCGPCSEIHYYMGPDPGDMENRAANVNGPGDTITEIWNLVFMEYNRFEVESGQFGLERLPAPSVDTGMGLERLAVVLQGVKTNYETDLLKNIVEFTAKLSDIVYEPSKPEGLAMRVIADHARATAFSIADGILPSGRGDRGSVLRKIIRRAMHQGIDKLGFENLFFNRVTDFVVDEMKGPYPELEAQRGFIEKIVTLEEKSFLSLRKFEEEYDEMSSGISRAVGILSEEMKKPDPDWEAARARIKEDLDDNERRWGNPSHKYDRLAWLAYKHKVPPSYIQAKFGGSNELFEGFSPFNSAHFGNAMYKVLRNGTPEERHILETVDNEYRAKDWSHRSQALLSRLDALFEGTDNLKIANYKDFARLYDTFGQPRDRIHAELEERDIRIPEDVFLESFDTALRELQGTVKVTATFTANVEVTARATVTVGVEVIKGLYTLAAEELGPIEFVGYDNTRLEGIKVRRLFKGKVPQLEIANELNEGDEGELVLDRTPFYAESGGQVGDTGTLAGGSTHVTVTDTVSPVSGLIVHKVKVEKGTLKVGDTVTAEVDVEKRDATRRNHTATHLMHAALREVLGTHVKQAGSVVAPNYLRFDFTHYQPLTGAEIEEIERLVNYHILRNEPVQTDEMAVEEAMRSGAMALFGEKYGEKVRVLSIKGAEAIFSKELCGGTHVRATGDIGVFKITSDESIASGVRRIRAITGIDAYQRFREDEEIIGQVTSDLRTSRAELPAMIGKLQDELKKARREAEELKLKIATGAMGSAASNGDDAREVAGVRVLAREASGLDAAGMRQLSDTLLARIKSGVVVIGRSNDGKASLIVRTSDDLTKKVPAGLVIKELAPIIGGKGGGKADMAEGGGNQPEKLAEALEASYGVIERMLQV